MVNSKLILYIILSLTASSKAIQLDFNNLIGVFNYLTSSKYIDLYDNKIDKILPGTFDEYSSLEYLYLDGNQLTKIENNLFTNLSNLKEIWLESNNIISIDKNAFNGLNKLELICLFNNPITNIYPQSVAGLCGNNINCKVVTNQKCTKKYEVEFRYLGCYNDELVKDLSASYLEFDKLTAEVCALHCRNNGFVYMALQNGNECRCDNTYGKYNLSNSDLDCNISCPGDKREKCGGILKNSIYQIKLANESNEILTSYPCSKRSDPGVFTFKRNGAFTVQFIMQPLPFNITSLELKVGEFKFTLIDKFILLENEEIDSDIIQLDYFKSPQTNLLHFNNSENVLWVSVYSLDRNLFESNFIKIGSGYQLENNLIIKFIAKSKLGVEMLRNVKNIEIDRRIKLKEEVCFINPFVKDYSYLVYDSALSNRLSIEDLDKNLVTRYNLPAEGLILYELVKNIVIDQEILDGIDYSIENEGCSLNTKLKDKAMLSFGSNDSRTSYIRVPCGVNFGNQPGQPFVIEIWPKGHSSPVHNHGNTVAIIKILSGTLKTEWYNPLAETYNETPKPIKSGYLVPGDITWMTSNYYQTHKLLNINSTRAAVSVQAYGYTSSEIEFPESFNYVLPGDGLLHRFYPTADYSFEELKTIVLSELRNKKCKNV